MNVVRLGASLERRIREHLASAYPEEGCGVFLGRDRDGARELERAIPLANAREDSRHNRYLIGPEEMLAADREARALGLDVLGFYHSHPDHPARPSAFDLEHAWPYYSYLIVSVERGVAGDMHSYRLTEDRTTFEPESLEIVPDERAVADGEP